MPAKRPTINDVAARAGVSKATVSAVLNDSAVVRASTRDRVLSAIELMNYRPSQMAAQVATRRGRSIGLIIKEADNPYYAEVVAGARAHASAHGYLLVVTSSEGDYEAERAAAERLRAMDVDGLIVTPSADADLSYLFELKRRNYPFVILEAVRGVPASLVDVDNVEASRQAARHLIDAGHTRIVHFAGPSYSMHTAERVAGVRHAYSESRLVFTDDDVIAAGAHLDDGYRAALAYFGARHAAERPTGVTCYNDLVAVGVCRALSELGMRVPDDVSVVGFDDIALCAYLQVPLTTMRVPKFRMGELAAQLLLRDVEAPGAVAPEKVYLAAELVVRDSTRVVAEPAAAVLPRTVPMAHRATPVAQPIA